MALAPLNGYSPSQLNTDAQTASQPPTNANTLPQIESPDSANDVLRDLPFVKNNALEQLAFDSSQYPSSYAQIQGYMAGHRIPVTYFSLQNSRQSVRTGIADSSEVRANIHTEYERWDQFEITLAGPMTVETNQETKSSTLTFVARLYPGHIAKNGDYILTDIGDNQIGVFKVVRVSIPSTWREQRCFEIGCYMISILTDEWSSRLQACTSRRLIFNKNDGDNSLLTEDNYSYVSEMNRLRNGFCSTYYRMFYDRRHSTLFRPDGVYDPYVVRFINNLASVMVTGHLRAVQLLIDVEHTYPGCIWSRLEDPYFFDLSFITPTFGCCTRTARENDTFATALSGRPFVSIAYAHSQSVQPGQVAPIDDSLLPYVFSSAFYNGDTANMSEFETIVYTAITTRNVPNIPNFITNYIRTWESLPRNQLFYRIPLYVWLMDMAIDNLSRRTS